MEASFKCHLIVVKSITFIRKRKHGRDVVLDSVFLVFLYFLDPKNEHIYIHFDFKHFDKENDCVDEPTKPHHWRRLFITFYIVNFLLFKNENSTYLMK